jgi:hypothetical protein
MLVTGVTEGYKKISARPPIQQALDLSQPTQSRDEVDE